MPSGLEFYTPDGKLVYSSALFKLFRQAEIIEPTNKEIIVGSSRWIYTIKLTYTIPPGRGIVFFGYFGGITRLHPTESQTFSFNFRGQSVDDNGNIVYTTSAALDAKYKLNAHIMVF